MTVDDETSGGVERIGTNSGHGHVWARPDGMRARCSGEGLCPECRADAELVRAMEREDRGQFTGRLHGGPDDGTLIRSFTRRVRYEQVKKVWADGPLNPPQIHTVRGVYLWNDTVETFYWERER